MCLNAAWEVWLFFIKCCSHNIIILLWNCLHEIKYTNWTLVIVDVVNIFFAKDFVMLKKFCFYRFLFVFLQLIKVFLLLFLYGFILLFLKNCCRNLYDSPNKHVDAFWHLCSRWLLKTLWQKEKLLLTCNFSFCHNVFKSIN